MTNNLRPRTLITGAAKGLGAEIAKELASKGYSLVIHYNESHESAKSIAEECRAFGVEVDIIQGDFSTPDSTQDFIRRYIKNFSATENIINNVGNYFIKSTLNTLVSEWQEIYQTNFFAPLEIIQALVQNLKDNKGAIINIGVVGIGDVRADTYSSAYTSSKLSLWMLTRSLAKELVVDQVRVNMVSPGYMENSVDIPADLFRLLMGRMASLSEVAGVVSFLLDKDNSYITGQNIEVAGGVRL